MRIILISFYEDHTQWEAFLSKGTSQRRRNTGRQLMGNFFEITIVFSLNRL
jgi:hypothetical protein